MEKTMKARVQHKHDVEANWLKATNFTPLASEIIVYDPDENYDYPRIKIGDGKTNINTLPFVTKDYAKISDIPTKPEDIGALPDSTVIPTVPTKISAFENDKGYLTQHQSLDAYAKTADLGALATKDSLTASDVGALPDTTKIPSTLSDLTADSTHRTVTDTEKNTWNAKANASDIPTKVSDLTNDKGYITSYTETDPTVPSWAKAATKPSYTKTEIGLGNVDNVKQYSTNNPPVLVRSEAPEDKSVIWVDPDDESKEEALEIKESIIAEYGAIYSSFPTEEQILAMPNRTYFTVRTSLEQTIKLASYYRTTSWKPGAFKYIDANENEVYVLPLNQSDGELYMPNYGIKTGEANAENNSALMEKIISWASYGATIRFPVGRFFFSRPINITKHLQIIGASTTAHYDEALTGTTILVFPNLQSGEAAISMDQGTISNLTIAGDQYDFRIERNEDGDSSTSPEVTIHETIPTDLESGEVHTYGLKAASTMKIHNVGVRNFYYGIWCDVGNISITNVTCRHCCYGLSIANDTKVINLFGADNVVLLQIRGSLSSAIGLRCDNVGKHLVEIVGSCSCITLMDLDAEFCMGAIIAVGDGVNITNLKTLEVSGVHGRSSVSQRYNKNDAEITAKDATADTVDDFGVITVKNNSILNGAIITTNQRPVDNSPFDNDQEKNYVVPYVLLAAGEGATAKNIQITTIGDFGDENPQEWASKRIASFSNLEDACSIKVQTYTGYIKYTKSNGITTIIDDATDMYWRMGLEAKFA